MDANGIRWKCAGTLEITKRHLYSEIRKGDGLDCYNDVRSTLPSLLGAFILSNSKRTKNSFIRLINGFYRNSIYYGDPDSLYIEKN